MTTPPHVRIAVRDARQIALCKSAASGRVQPMPADPIDKHALQKLKRKGAVRFVKGEKGWWICPDVKLDYRMDLLARLRAGPYRAEDWRETCSSRTSLRQRIRQLRDQGYRIETEREGGNPHYGPAIYVLIEA